MRTRISLRGRASASLVCAYVLFTPVGLRAQTADAQSAAAASALYDEATRDLDAKRYEVACPKLEKVTRQLPDALGAKLTLAKCYEGLGKLASASSQYSIVETLASRAGQNERASKAALKVKALKPKLAMLTLEVAQAVRSIPNVTIARDGVPLDEGEWSAPIPVDNGEHAIVVTAPGYKSWTGVVRIEKDGSRSTLAVQAPEKEAAKVVTDLSVLAPKTALKPTSTPAQAPATPRSWQRPAAFVGMGLGALGIGAGAILGGLAVASANASREGGHCDENNRCDATGAAAWDQAVAFGNASTAAFVAGGVFAAGGVALWLTAPSSGAKEEKAGAAAVVKGAAVEIRPTSVAVRARW